MAQALVPAVSRLVSTLIRGCDVVSKAGVGMSADAAGMSACATSYGTLAGNAPYLGLMSNWGGGTAALAESSWDLAIA